MASTADLVDSVTSEKLKEMDWTISIEICELVTRDQTKAKDVIKSIKKRLGKKSPNTQLYAVMLLEMLINNCGEHVHRLVVDTGLLPILVKIVKKKSDYPVRERIFLMLDAAQTNLGGASGKFPQYYAAYYELVSSRVQFPQQPHVPPSEQPAQNVEAMELTPQEPNPKSGEISEKHSNGQIFPEPSILEKAASVLDVLKDVMNAMNPQHPEGAMDEFVLDLVEQCSFQKQRVMHLVMTSKDETVVTQAIELNEQLQKILDKHDSFLVINSLSFSSASTHEEAEEDEEHLYRRLRKGKACAEDQSRNGLVSIRSIPEEKWRQPLSIHSAGSENSRPTTTDPVSLPPPPSKHVEREKFFREKQSDGGLALAGHVRGLSLHSRNGSSSLGGSGQFENHKVPSFHD